MNVCRMEDLVEIEAENNINQTINGMFYLLDASEVKINAIKNQNWFQRMLFSVFGKNKASLKDIQENKDKINKYVAEAIAEMYNRNMISESYIVSLGNRINEISLSNSNLRRQLFEIGSALNEKIESVDHYHVLRGLIDEGKFSDYPELYTLIFITSSCDKRVITDDDHVWLLEKSLKKAGLLCKDLNIADEFKAIAELPAEKVEGILIETNRVAFDKSLIEIFSGLETLKNFDNTPSHLVISGEKLFSILIEDKKKYFEFLGNKRQEQIAETEEIADEIDFANIVGVYNRKQIPTEMDFLKKRDLDGVLVIEEKTTFSNEELHIRNQIKCKETLRIEDSIIYVDETVQGYIEVLEGSTLVFKNCLIVGKDVWERPFIKINKGYFVSENSIYNDCNSFIKIDSGTSYTSESIVELNYCEGLNCGPKFIETSWPSDFIELNNCFFNWREDTATYKSLIPKLEKDAFLEMGYNGKCQLKNCSFVGNAFCSIWEEYGFIRGNENVIEGCIFEDISGNIESSILKNSSVQMTHTDLEIKEVLFCKFVDSERLCLKGHYKGGVNIEGCRFERINNSEKFNSEIVNVRRDKEGRINTIKNCTFTDIYSEYDIIKPETFNASKNICVLSIEKCNFINCKSENGEIIKLMTHSYGFWTGKEKKHENVVVIRNCSGI